MSTEMLDGLNLKTMISAGQAGLARQYRQVDALNVFPVPDGDTGTNMLLTMTTAVEAVAATNPRASAGEVAEAAFKGALMGARGNSGVILSQLLRGLAKGLKDLNEVSGEAFACALELGVKLAFQVILKPVEGTILTVAREAAAEAVRAARKHLAFEEILGQAVAAAHETLLHTPEMLPILKEAGVVDAGGMGWLVILQGFRAGLNGDQSDFGQVPGESPLSGDSGLVSGSAGSAPNFPGLASIRQDSVLDLRFPYCTEMLINTGEPETEQLRLVLRELGDSLLVVRTEDIVKVHVHTDHPGLVLEECLKFGTLSKISISNMIEQAAAARVERKPLAIISVAMGEGVKNIMLSLGADLVVNGGQTMNPSIQDLLQAVEEANAERVVLLPNNGNILLTAQQVQELTEISVRVVPTTTIPQGIAALLAAGHQEPEKMLLAMEKAARSIRTGEVTYAARDSVVNGRSIRQGDILGLADELIVAVGDDLQKVVEKLMASLTAGGGEICSFYFGQDIDRRDAEELVANLTNKYPDFEFELHDGGQPFYYYLISVE